ncbi:hypothetical protein J2Y68_003497, partial [Paenarthrobacter nitroguajacolicus]|nr:hypothetical protein [Paenarthrobacter nitroguajacolicus]
MHKNYRAQTLTALGAALTTLVISGGVVALPASASVREVPAIASLLERPTVAEPAQFLLTTKDGVEEPAIKAGAAAQEAAAHLGVEVKALTQKNPDVFQVELEKALTADDAALFLTSLQADASVKVAVSEDDAEKQTAFAVSPGSPDMAAPVLVSSSVSKTSFNLADGPAVVTATVRLTDATGVKAPTVILSHSATGQQQGFGSMSLVSGTPQDGVWERTMTIPLGSATGQWDVTLYPVGDVLGNSGGGFRTLATLNVSGAVADVSAPVLVSSSVNKTSFNLFDGPAVVKASVRLKDQTGATAPTVILSHSETWQQQGFGSMSLVSGTPQDGVWERTMTLPEWAATGKWDVTLYPLRDAIGNSGGGFRTLATIDVQNQAPRTPVTPAAVTFTDKDGTKDDVYVVPATTGVEYLVGGRVVAAGTYPGSETVTVTARAVTDYVLASGATASWTGTFKSTPFVVTPAAVLFTDKDGTKDDVYVVPATAGVEYLVGGKVVAAGTYPGSGTVTVTARAVTDYVLAAGATASWTGT